MLGLFMMFAEMLWLLLLLEIGFLTWTLNACTKSVVEKGIISESEWRRFVRGIGLIGTAFALTLASLQYGSGAMNIVCLHVETSLGVQLSGNVLGLGIPAVILGWIWLGGGAAYLARIAHVFSAKGRQYTARQVRLRVTSVLVVMLLAAALLQGKEPAGLTEACRAIRNAPSEWEQWERWKALQGRET